MLLFRPIPLFVFFLSREDAIGERSGDADQEGTQEAAATEPHGAATGSAGKDPLGSAGTART